jgi:hypothetical protein
MADTIQQRKQKLEETITKLDQQIQITTGINKENMDNTTKFNTDMTRWLGLINTQVLSLKPLIGNLQNLIKQLKSESGKVVDTGNDNSEMIRNLQEQLAQKNAEIADLKKQQPEGQQMLTEDMQKKFQEQIADLNTQIQTLQAENRKLATDKQVLDEMVNQSYQAIVRAGQTLGQVQKQQINEEEFKRVLTGIQGEVEQIKTDLTNLLGGPPTGSSSSSSSSSASPAPKPPAAVAPGMRTVGNELAIGQANPPTDEKWLLDEFTQNVLDNAYWKDIPLRQIIKILYGKPAFNKDGVTPSKYRNALVEILRNNVSMNVPKLSRIFQNNRITNLKIDELDGGKRRRKSKKTQKKRNVRKQKGGFEYSGKSKRRRFSVTRSTSKPRSSQPRTSSQPTSSYETQSSVPNYRARGTKKSKM